MLSWSAQLGSARDLKEVDKTMYCGESGETAERERERDSLLVSSGEGLAGLVAGGLSWPTVLSDNSLCQLASSLPVRTVRSQDQRSPAK